MWQEMYRLVFSYLHRRGLDHQDAEDLAQEVMIAACIHLDAVEPGKLKPWLYTVARYKYIDWLRRHRRGVVLVNLEAVADLTAGEGEPETQVLDQEYSDIVRTIMEGLNQNERGCLILKYNLDLSIEEIARTLRLKPNTVKVILYRARQKFKQEYQRLKGVIS